MTFLVFVPGAWFRSWASTGASFPGRSCASPNFVTQVEVVQQEFLGTKCLVFVPMIFYFGSQKDVAVR
jgi:hypothetical protein